MSKNLIPEIAKMLGVKLGEEFKIDGNDSTLYRLEKSGLRARGINCEGKYSDTVSGLVLEILLTGDIKIVKLPWKPKKGEDYYTFGCVSEKWEVIQQTWTNHPFDLALINKDWIYRTKAEAQAALPAVAKEMGVEYEL